jgi:signal peptide peptidase SppA
MKQYPHCVEQLFYKPLAITQARHAALWRVLESRMRGDMPLPVDDSEPDEDDFDGELDVRGGTGVIPVHGVITAHASDIPASSCGCGLDIVQQQTKAARADSSVERILFHFKTPGGSVTGVPEAARLIGGIREKPTIGYTDDECCSAGVWLATQCEQFYTMPSASVGSIGVWCAYVDLSRQMANEGVSIESFQGGKFKLMGAYWKTLSDEERGMLQADVDKIYAQFKDAVGKNREVSSEYMDGRIFDGAEACDIGLCDGMYESLDDLIDAIEG